MRKLILYIATSIDGMIAGEKDDLSWLDNYPNPRQTDYGYNQFYESVDTLLMGGNTFRAVANLSDSWPYPDKHTYLITRTEKNLTIPNISILGENWINEIKNIKAQNGGAIWLVGGSLLVKELLKHDLIDKMIISQFPILLGKGTRLFYTGFNYSSWEMSKGRFFTNGVIQAEYIIKR